MNDVAKKPFATRIQFGRPRHELSYTSDTSPLSAVCTRPSLRLYTLFCFPYPIYSNSHHLQRISRQHELFFFVKKIARKYFEFE